jgi:hypothetical protein
MLRSSGSSPAGVVCEEVARRVRSHFKRFI